MKSKVLLVDGKNLLWRVVMTMGDLATPETLTGGVHGFFLLLQRVHSEYGGRVYVCWEPKGGKLFRKSLYDGYKDRGEMTEEREEMVKFVSDQMAKVSELLGHLGIRQSRSKEWEADDVMGTLAADADGIVRIYTGDRDLLQCVSDTVTVVQPGKGGEFVEMTPESVLDKYGVSVGQFPDFKAFVGDAGDCIPGAKGIGEKGAAQLLKHFFTHEQVIKAAKSGKKWPLPPGLQKKVVESEANIRLSYRLAKINTQAKVKTDRGEVNEKAAKSLLKKWRLVQVMSNYSAFERMR